MFPVSMLSPASDTALSPQETVPLLGDVIAEGFFGVVYLDGHNTNKVIKVMKENWLAAFPDAEEECALFKRYYGDHAAEVIQHHGKCYLRLDRLPGKRLSDIEVFHDNAETFFWQMIREMESKDIYHADLKLENLHYCAEQNRFYPLDFSNDEARLSTLSSQEMAQHHHQYQYRIDTIAHFIAWHSVAIQQYDSAPPLGAPIGVGAHGKVYLDTADPEFVWKKFHLTNHFSLQKARQEACAFRRYYGSDAAEVMISANASYIRMRKVPGTPLHKIPIGGLDHHALPALYNMYSALSAAKIMHGDLYENNLHYDAASHQFFPLDFEDQYYAYFLGDRMEKNVFNYSHAQMHYQLIEQIQLRIAAPNP